MVRKFALCAALIVFVILLDALCKYLALRYLSYGVPVSIFPGLNLSLANNTGAAFSLFNQGGWQKILLILIEVLLIGFLVFRLYHAKTHLESIALCLVIGGAFGNLINRLLMGYVIDFIDLYIGQHHWPTFNVADSCIVVGAGLWGWSRASK